MIIVKGLSKTSLSGKKILRGVDLEIMSGEIVVVQGGSGSGKTTLIKLLAAQERVEEGEIQLGSINLRKVPANGLPYIRRHIGYIPQVPRFLEEETVINNVLLPISIEREYSRQDVNKALLALSKVRLKDKSQYKISSLSFGERQRVAIARVINDRPSIILADEPMTQLDESLEALVMTLFLDLAKYGVTILITHHSKRELAIPVSKIMYLEQGSMKAYAQNMV